MTFFQLSLFCAFVALSLSANGENTTLLLVQTFSRHGERGPHFLYPNDPNSPDDFPNGLGMLTQQGKKTHRDVGKFFRSLYNDSITSNPDQVFVNSSAQDRCLMSAQSQLSSFFAPNEYWRISPDIEWQPIAVHYLPIELDRYLNYQRFCPRAEQTLSFHHLEDHLAENPTMVENISNYSGLNYSDPENAFELYGILETEKSHNLIIPEWAEMYWDQMRTVEEMALKAFYSSPIQLRLRVGSLLALINKNMNDKINGKNPDLKFIVNLTLTLLGVLATFGLPARGENTTLLLVQTITRHGDRAPHFLYPNDPNSPDDFPNGLGRLTQLGKKQQYDVGKFFRSLYNETITTDPEQVFVNSSAQDRCLNSAQSQLASFFAPNKNWMLTPDLDWQPIAVHYVPIELDRYLNYQRFCPRADETLSFKEFQEYIQQRPKLVKLLSKYSGFDISTPGNAWRLESILEVEKSHNLTIPEWADKYWDQLKTMSEKIFSAFYRSPTQIRLRVGSLLGLINRNMKDKIDGKNPYLKFILNFTHDEQLAGLLGALNYTHISRPTYCSTLLIELHEMPDTSKAVRVRYMNTSYPLQDAQQPHILSLEGCSEFCPLAYFMNSYQALIPEDLAEECQANRSEDIS